MLDFTGPNAAEPQSLPPGSDLTESTPPTRLRNVVPRRPLRLSPPEDAETPDPRQALQALNIFADLFDGDPVPATDTHLDPRIAASRRRARRSLTRSDPELAPDEANFWHPLALADDLHTPSGHTPAAASPQAPVIPLHEQLALIRSAIYAPDPEVEARQVADANTARMRLASHTMNATLMLVAFPVGAAITTHTLLRGSDIRLSAQAMAIVGTILAASHGGFSGLL